LIHLGVAELRREVEAMSKLGEPFLTPDTRWRFDRLKAQLVGLTPGRTLAWSVPSNTPLVTEPSLGEYEAGNRGGGVHAVVAHISFLWHLTARGAPLRVDLSGNATTRIELFDALADQPTSLAMWRMEVGAEDGPGCCFHVQVLGSELEPPFPKSLPIPRLPVFPVTPMAALEFVLSELFQEEWRKRVARSEPSARQWRGLQRDHWVAFLAWQKERVESAGLSPLVSLKAFPKKDIFA
jgi:hypothetical protein